METNIIPQLTNEEYNLLKTKFIITVHQLVSDHRLDPDDLDYRPEGAYSVEATDIENALDIFHSSVPVACLDDYEIDVIEFKGEL
jgi:hypothetical protein